MSVRFLPMRCTICFSKVSDTNLHCPEWVCMLGLICFGMYRYVFLCLVIA
jgi:hypothetical protein